MIKQCECCKAQFETNKNSRKFCSAKCNNKYHWHKRVNGLSIKREPVQKKLYGTEFFDWRDYQTALI